MNIKINLTLPKNWNELSDWQLQKICAMLNKRGPAFDFMVFLILNHVHWYQFIKAYKLRVVLNNVPLSELKNHFMWVYKKIDRTIFPNHKKYIKPMDRIINLTIEEYSIADDLNNMYIRTKNKMYLRLLCGVLYRHKSEAYNHLQLEAYAKRFKHSKIGFLYAVHMAFNGSKTYIVEKYPNVYPQIKKAIRSNKKSGFMEVVLKMSGQKFGTYNETRQTLVYTFLTDLEESILQQKQLEQKYGKARHA